MKNNSRSPVAEMLSGKYKIWLIVGLAIMFVVDCMACGVLIARGSSGYLFLPIVMTIIDALYLAAVVFSNQRFKYAKTLFIVYITFTAVCFVLWFVADMRNTIFTDAAAAMWIVLHLTSACAAIISYIYAAKRIRGGRTIQLILAIAFSCVAVLGCGVYYGIQLFTDGYFGQGSGVRPLRYEYYADNTCAVVGVINGNEKDVVVPYEFNGYKVVEVSALVLDDGVKNITLNCDTDVELFQDYDRVGASNYNVNIYVEKDKVDVFKKKLYDISVSSVGYYNIFDMGNRVRPMGLDKDEVYVTFDHDRDAYTYGKKQIIPTWYGKKGEVFDLKTAAEGVDYALHADVRSDDDLYWSYNNCSQRIMSALEYKSVSIDGKIIGESCFNVPVRFQKIFCVYAGSGNDDMYDAQKYFNYSKVDGVDLDYRMTVAENGDELLEALDRGEGFKREMRYYASRDTIQTPLTGTPFSSLTELLQSKEHEADVRDITITPYWALVQPDVDIKTLDDKTEVVYGDRFSLTAEVTHPLGDDIEVIYEWYTGGVRRGYEQTYNEEKITYIGDREYMITVTVHAPAISSLSTVNAKNIYINSSKRPLTAVWTDPASNVYDGNVKTITLAFENVVDGDDVHPYTATFTQRNVSSYTYTARLSGIQSDYYYIASGSDHTYEVLPCPVKVEWGGESFLYEYNGNAQMPVATALDLTGSELLLGYVLPDGSWGVGTCKDAGSYTIVAKFSNSNYIPDSENGNDRRLVVITPKSVDIEWGSTELTYNGQYQAPTASITGVDGKRITASVTGNQMRANLVGGEITTPYIATASIQNGNYMPTLDTTTKTFVIKPFEVTVNWYNTVLTYNGQPQAPRATAMGVNANLNVTVTGQETDVGGDYTATAAIDSTDYVITSGESQMFAIVPYTLKVTWSNDVFTYDGQPHNPAVSATGVNGVIVAISVTSAPQTEAGTYTATAGITDYNYTIATADMTHRFTINKRNVTVSWINTTLTYNGQQQAPTPRLLYAIGDPAFTVTGQETNANVGTAKYTASIELNDDNHVVSQGATCSYTINPMTAEVQWDNLILEYNGQFQKPTASITGADGSKIELNVAVALVDKYVVGTYGATAFLEPLVSDGTMDNSGMVNVDFNDNYYNYTLTGTTKSYTIVKRKINVTVRDITTWQGYQPQYDFDYDGVVDGDTAYLFCGIAGENDANLAVGTYDITVYLFGTDCGNYELNIVRHGKLTVTAQGA